MNINPNAKQKKLVDLEEGQIITVSELGSELLLERRSERYSLPENVTIGAEASLYHKNQIEEAIAYNNGEIAHPGKPKMIRKEVEDVNGDFETLTETVVSGLEKMKAKELRQHARDLGIKIPRYAKKEDLIKLIIG